MEGVGRYMKASSSSLHEILKMLTTTAHYEIYKLIKIGCMWYVMFGEEVCATE